MSKVKEYLQDKELDWLKPRTKCIGCGQTVAHLYRDGDCSWIEDGVWLRDESLVRPRGKDGWLCYACYDYDLSEPICSGVVCLDGDRIPFKIGSYLLDCEDEIFDQVKAYSDALHWHSTDPWRGYFETKGLKGWTKVIDTWFCGFDGHNVVGDLAKFHDVYEEKKNTPDFDMVVAFPRLSNVLTCGIEVWVRPTDVENFKSYIWVENLEIGGE